jgi:adenylate cyclase
VQQARRYWRALGFADAGDEATFTGEDLAALRTLLTMVGDDVIDRDFSINLTRAMGHTLARLAEWQVEALIEHVRDQGHHGSENAAASMALAEKLLPDMERLLGYVWRRQLVAAGSRALAAAERDGVRGLMSVGFADLVAYTRLTQRLPESELATLVIRFGALSADIVAAGGGRIVKNIGDEVLFAADGPAQAAEIALQLAESMAADPGLPDVRVGVATGPVVARLGDVFGRTVNLASRITASAEPGTVLVDRPTAAALEEDPDFVVDSEGVRAVRGLGLVEPRLLRRRRAIT